MPNKIKLFVLAMICFSINPLSGQNSECNISEKMANGKLAMEIDNNKIKHGIPSTIKVQFKMPAKSTEVNDADWVSCKGFMPNRAKIESIEITSITGLPDGITWYCDKANCFYKGEEVGCVTLAGTALEKGTYELVVNLKGVGSIFGIKKNYDCLIETLSIVVH